MSQIGDFFARIVSTGGSRGLSGDSELVLPAGPAASYFNERLRRHATSDDLVAEPDRLWDTSGLFSRRGGLAGHLTADRGDGVLGFSDVLIVINRDDWRRSFREVRRPWVIRVQNLLTERLQALCQEEDLHFLFPQRPVHFTVVEDGSEQLGDLDLGLQRGEFVTGLLPNHYTGPVEGSQPVVSVHLNLPGQWAGYREAGTLWSDQVLFTLGAHAFDNFRHPALQEPALYRLHRYGDGSFVHVINPELRDRYRISSQQTPGGASVLTIDDADDQPVAFIVLAVADGAGRAEPERPERPAPAAPRPSPSLHAQPTADRPAPVLTAGSRTVVPLELDERILTLRERGALLQKVHFARFMEGYDVFIGRSGEVATAMSGPAATLHVRGRQVTIASHLPGVRVSGSALMPDEPIFLEGDAVIEVGGSSLQYRDLSGLQEDGWPYLAEVRRLGATAHMVFGSRFQVGRDPRCKVRLPDEPHNDNIVWRPELRQGGTIRSRNGEIPKSRFYIDSIMVASEHAEIDLTDAPRVLSRARHCYTYVRRDGDVHPLYPTRDGGGPMEMTLEEGDELLVGNCVFEVSFVEPETHTASNEAPDPVVTAESLAMAVDDSDVYAVDDLVAGVAGLPPDRSLDPFDVPAAAGLGEAGRRPKAVMPGQPTDSLLGVEPPRVAPPMLTGSLSEFEPETADVQPVSSPSGPVSDLPDPLSEEVRRERPAPLDTSAPDDAAESMLDVPVLGFDAPDSMLDAPGFLGAPPAPSVPPPRPSPAPAPAGEDPTAVPVRPPPPVAIEASGDSILGDDLVPDPPAGLSARRVEAGSVAVVDEDRWQLELSRPGRLVQLGWMVSGQKVVGNHAGADLVVPENRSEPGQGFSSMDYLEVFCRGRRRDVKVLAPDEVRMVRGGEQVTTPGPVEATRFEVLRRDADGYEDFAVGLTLEPSDVLPDPRAHLLRIDTTDRMARALFTLGIPLRQSRTVDLAGISARLMYDGHNLSLAGYLSDYRRADGGFRPFFVSTAGGGFRTLPEDGTPVTLDAGDRVISGHAVFVFEG